MVESKPLRVKAEKIAAAIKTTEYQHALPLSF
jgi:hypothetical protein